MNEYVSINDLIKRDLIKKSNGTKKKMYQIQAEKNTNLCTVVYVGEYDDVPVVPILGFERGKHKFYLLSFVITEEELLNDDQLKLICFVIKHKKKAIGSLSLIFEPTEKITNFNVNKIILNIKVQNIYKKNVIRTYDEYPGREESIYLLTSIITEDNVIEKIVEKK